MKIQELEARVQAAEPNGTLKVNILHDDDSFGSEGVWCCFATARDKEIYEKNLAGESFDVFMMNSALIGGPSWGAKLTLKSTGDNLRSTIAVDEVIRQIVEASEKGDYPTIAEFEEARKAKSEKTD
jgi:hypothetical protein